MEHYIKVAGDVHQGARSLAEHLLTHAAQVAEARKRWPRLRVHESLAPLAARVDHGRWVVDCECGAGNMTDPAWGAATCLACGAVHRCVTFPDGEMRLNVEHLLLARTETKTRNWRPGERELDLAIENVEHGVAW